MKKAAIFLFLFLIFTSFLWGQQATFTWKGASGDNWDDPDSWGCDDPAYDTISYPGEGRNDDIVIINGFTGSIPITEEINIQELTIENSSIITINVTGSWKLTIEDFTVDSGSEIIIVDTNDDIKITNKLTAAGKVTINSGGGEILLKDIDGLGDVLLDAGTGDVKITGTVGADGHPLDIITVRGEDITFDDNVYATNMTVTGTGTVEFDGDVHAAHLTMDGIAGLKQNKAIVGEVIIAAGITALSEINITGELIINTGVSLTMSTHNLSASTLNNNGLIKLQGSQTATFPAGRIGGTVQYQGSTLSPWTFGYLYTNLIIDNSLTMGDAEDLNISGNAVFGSVIKAKTLTVGGSSTINANITTTGDQIYESVTLTGAITLTSTGGRINANNKVTGTSVTVNALHGISLAYAANDFGGVITLDNTQTGTPGNIIFTNTSALSSLTVKNNSTNGNITINQTGDLPINLLQTTGVSSSISIKTTGNVTQTGAIKTSSLKVEAGTGITLLTQTNTVTASVNLISTSGDIKFFNDRVSAGNLSVKVDTPGDITITEKLGGLIVDEIAKGDNVDLNAHTNIKTEAITVSGSITMKAGGDITVTDITAYQLVAIAVGKVEVNTVIIESNTENEGKSAAIYIEADDFEVTAAPFSSSYSIVPGGTGGQLCLNLDNEWKDTGAFVDGDEDNLKDPSLAPPNPRWHQHFISLSGLHLVYGDGTLPDDVQSMASTEYIVVLNSNSQTKFILDDDKNVYICNADSTSDLRFETGDSGTIKFYGTNKFTDLTLKADTNITLENINTLSDITVETSGTILISQNIVTTGKQEYSGEVALVNDVTLTSTSTTKEITLGNIAGSSKSLIINGKGVLNGGSGIENLSVNGTTTINANITTEGTQTYLGAVTLGGDVTLTSATGAVTLGTITGSTKSLTIAGNGVLNGGSGIHDLSVTGTATINADITAGTQTYDAVTLTGTGTRTLTGATVTLGQFTGPGTGLSLTITGGGVLNGGSGIGVLSVSGTTAINGDITAGTQTYSGAVTLGGDVTLTSTAGSVTLGAITGSGKSLTITGIGVLNGGSGIKDLSVSGAATINADITTTGNQTYIGAATLNGTNLDGTNKRTITSQTGNIEFKNTLGVVSATKDIIELLAASGNITITGQTTAYQLIAKASTSKGTVKVYAITINSSNTGDESENAAIYIVADNFTVTTTTPKSIVPGGKPAAGQLGQLCLHLNKKWMDTNGVVDGPEDDPVGTPNARWHQHFMVVGKILYSFTEDSNGNGKLDRIRVQTNKDLLGNFDNFEVSVDGGYKVIKFELVNNNDDSFYIYLEEKVEFDGDKTPQWSITKNTSLIDATHNPILDQTEMEYIDTIPPRIVYTLTLPGHPQTYVQLSEPVQTLSGVNISAGDISFDGRTVTAVKEENLGYLFDYSTSYKVEDLANLTDIDSATIGVGYFQMNNIVDKGQEPVNINSSYPPKYPTDWNYTAYASSSALVPPNKLIGVMSKTDNDPVIRRVTDVLVSLSSNNYFVWPVWAKPSEDNISIMEFDGSKYLEKAPIEKSGIELQARISNNLAITPQLFWTTADIPANMRNPKEASDGKKTGGLWLPSALTNPLYYYVPLSNGIKTALVSNISPLFNYDISANDLANSGAKFEFIFRSSSASDMFIARLDAPLNTIPDKWYTLVRPFSFNVQSIRYQRGGVTILNNVINSDNKETAYIRYDLPRAGRVTVQIYTLDGTLVKSIRRNENREAGAYVDTWDGSNNGGRAVARGMYFVRVVGPDIDEIRKIMVVK